MVLTFMITLTIHICALASLIKPVLTRVSPQIARNSMKKKSSLQGVEAAYCPGSQLVPIIQLELRVGH